MKALEREYPRASAGERDPSQGLGVFCPGGARPPRQAMIGFIDDHREAYGVEPICVVLPIAPSTYRAHAARGAILNGSARVEARCGSARPDPAGFRRELPGLRRSQDLAPVEPGGEIVARCTVERLMRDMGLQGVVRGKPVKTTMSEKAAPWPPDLVERQFLPRGRTCCGSPTYVCGNLGGLCLRGLRDRRVRRRIVGWRVSRSVNAGLVLDALEQALRLPTRSRRRVRSS